MNKDLGCMSQKSDERSQIGIGTNFIHIQRNGNLVWELNSIFCNLHMRTYPMSHPSSPWKLCKFNM